MASVINQVVVIIRTFETELIQLRQQSIPGEQHTLGCAEVPVCLFMPNQLVLSHPRAANRPLWWHPAEGSKAPHWEPPLGWFCPS